MLRISLALGVFAYPAGKILQVRVDPNLLSETPIAAVWGWHRSLTARFGPWAASRVHSGRAASLPVSDISGTEWPAYSAVYYLRATLFLQAHAQRLGRSGVLDYSASAIEHAADLIADPGHASWVIAHWGAEYLNRENVFYRMLLIDGLVSYQQLTGNPRFETLIRTQALGNVINLGLQTPNQPSPPPLSQWERGAKSAPLPPGEGLG